MRRMMGVIKDRHGTYYARRKVPEALQEATAVVLNVSKARQVWLKKSLATKDLKEANIRAKPVEIAFDRTLADAAAMIKQRPLRGTLAQAEIGRIAEYHYATTLANDDEERREGTGNEELIGSIARQLTEGGVDFEMPLPLTARPKYGLSDREVAKRSADLEWLLPIMQEALARGDLSKVSEHLQELLHVFQINLDAKCEGYRKLGMAVLQADVEALRIIARRNEGEPIATPSVPTILSSTAAEPTGETLRAAFEGWKRERQPSPRTLTEYQRAIDLFVDLHGDLPVTQIKRSHARIYREALQQVPRHRTGSLLKAPLHQVIEWAKEHPTAPRVSAPTVNKLIGGVQATLIWAHDKGGFIPDDVAWADPFARMRLDVDEPDREPFAIAELQTLFGSPVFTDKERPKAGRGDAAYWLPLLALFTGGRRGELTSLSVADVSRDSASGETMLTITEDRLAGKTLKTRNSQRVLPVHPELRKLGFLDYVSKVERTRGDKAWLFPLVAPEVSGGEAAWTKWFGRYIRSLGIKDTAKVFHSLRHNFIDAMRAGGVDEELRMALAGHGWMNTTSRGYGAKDMLRRFTARSLALAVAKVTYPGLGLSRLYPGRQTTRSRPK